MEILTEKSELEREQLWLSSFMLNMKEIEPTRKRQLCQYVRSLAGYARKNAAARSIIERALPHIENMFPCEAETFRAYYLTGGTQPTAKFVGRTRHIDKRTVYRHISRITQELLPYIFGLDGVFSGGNNIEIEENNSVTIGGTERDKK